VGRTKLSLICLLTLVVAGALVFAANTPVLRSATSALSQSLTPAAKSTAAASAPATPHPKKKKRKRHHRHKPAGSPAPVAGAKPKPSPSATPGHSTVAAAPSTSATPAPKGTPVPANGQSSTVRFPTPPPQTRTITIAWTPSPDQSVVGYQLYRGSATHEYVSGQPLGPETSAQISVDQSATYLAVSAYTAEGFESDVCEELVVASGAGGN